ncbi:MAG: CCA tRNA nucleotidyltransferase [Dehalococcoidia bacterium]
MNNSKINISQSIKEYLSNEVFDLLIKCGRFTEDNSAKLFLVGGSLRDILLKKHPKDIDLTLVNGNSKLVQKLADYLSGEIIFKSQFFTYKLKVNNNIIDITEARKETYLSPGSLPKITSKCSIDDDLYRRDFTVNSMALSLNPTNFGAIIDPFNGMNDINNKNIRIIHDNSFSDDPTRILRAIRYSIRLNFKIDNQTLSKINEFKSNINSITGFRIKNELIKILREESRTKILIYLNTLKILDIIQPNINLNTQTNEIFDKFQFKNEYTDDLTLIGILVYNLNIENTINFAEKLYLDSIYIKTLRDANEIKQLLQSVKLDKLKNSSIYKHLYKYKDEAIKINRYFSNDIVYKKIDLYLNKLKNSISPLNGSEIISLGAKPGPIIKEIMDQLLYEKLDGNIKNKNEAKIQVNKILNR